MPDSTPLPYATFVDRLIARIIDVAIVTLPITLVMLYAIAVLRSMPLALLCVVAEAVYKPAFEINSGQTIGKRLRKIKVVNQKDQGEIDANQGLMRFLPWAAIAFTSVFILIRHFQSPDFADVDSIEAYLVFSREHVLGENIIIAIINYLPLFSVMWIFSDPMRRALHDRLGGTVVVKEEG
ncbi:RDD family protein [Neolewinella agarilytica]|uniref:RDD family protein n=1 Tax=Neolewinella agarilytica TaxID=478744 RepID=A0A1H9HWL1_9BACT|nr:RDD family protein [Neolewinella agarilytica]SEQ66706.1 RDD family protein [Neolewinella agarilytica]